jgi:hypothetical protein
MANKCIILLLDGTWNDAESGRNDTNIVRMRQIIAKSLDPSPRLAPNEKKMVAGPTTTEATSSTSYSTSAAWARA